MVILQNGGFLSLPHFIFLLSDGLWDYKSKTLKRVINEVDNSQKLLLKSPQTTDTSTEQNTRVTESDQSKMEERWAFWTGHGSSSHMFLLHVCDIGCWYTVHSSAPVCTGISPSSRWVFQANVNFNAPIQSHVVYQFCQ